jgi:hypothetical protein
MAGAAPISSKAHSIIELVRHGIRAMVLKAVQQYVFVGTDVIFFQVLHHNVMPKVFLVR